MVRRKGSNSVGLGIPKLGNVVSIVGMGGVSTVATKNGGTTIPLIICIT
jgi:hypothetical protein